MSFNDTFKNFTKGNKKGERTTDLLAPGRGYGIEKNNLSKIKIIALDNVTNDSVSELLINPNAITEQKSANWAKHYIPGQNDPLLQWISGSERVVSFSSKVTKDLADSTTVDATSTTDGKYTLNVNTKVATTLELDDIGSISVYEGELLKSLVEVSDQTEPKSSLIDSVGQGFSDVGTNIAAALITTPVEPVVSPMTKYLPLSIQKHLDYYRSLVMPRKSALENKAKAPTLVKLEMGDILGNRTINNNTKWILLDYNITVTKFTPSLIPIDAIVNFTFIEYVDENRVIDAVAIIGNTEPEYEWITIELDSTPPPFGTPTTADTLSVLT